MFILNRTQKAAPRLGCISVVGACPSVCTALHLIPTTADSEGQLLNAQSFTLLSVSSTSSHTLAMTVPAWVSRMPHVGSVQGAHVLPQLSDDSAGSPHLSFTAFHYSRVFVVILFGLVFLFKPGLCYVGQTDLELTVPLSSSPKCRDYKQDHCLGCIRP